jgi:hypothetical protein
MKKLTGFSILAFPILAFCYLATTVQAQEENQEDFCERFPYNSRCESSEGAQSPVSNFNKVPNVKETTIEETWKTSNPDVPWSQLLLVNPKSDSYYAVFDQNYDTSGIFFGDGNAEGVLTRWREDRVDVYLYERSDCNAYSSNCDDKEVMPVKSPLKIIVGEKTYSIDGNDGTFPISLKLRKVFQDITPQTSVSLKLKGEKVTDILDGKQVSKIGEETVKAMSRLYQLQDELESRQINVSLVPRSPQQELSSVRDIVSFIQPSIVKINSHRGKESGFLISKDGYILTNRDVVHRTQTVDVKMNDGRELEARVLKYDRSADMALLQIKSPIPNNITPLPLCHAASPSIGTEVMVIGENTVTKGIINGLRKRDHKTLIQTDAPIDSSNSGSPLVNQSGEVVGIINSNFKVGDIEGTKFAVAMPKVLDNLGLSFNSIQQQTNRCGNPK